MSEATPNDTTAPKKNVKAKPQKKTVAPKAATRKTKVEKTPKPKADNPPREDRTGWGTFALKLPIPEREAFHTAAGPAGASRFARTVLDAFANENEAAFKAALVEARKLRA